MNTTTEGISPPPHPFDQQWYVVSEGKALGPFLGSKLRDMISTGEINPKTRVCLLGAKEWSEATSIPFLSAIFAERAPPPSGPPPVTVQVDQRHRPLSAAHGAPTNLRYAGFWIRAAAYALDCIFVLIISFVIGGIVAAITKNPDTTTPIATLASMIIAILYFVAPVAGEKQATWGKQMLGLKIVRADGQKLGFGLALGRYLSYILSIVTLYIGFFMIGWTEQKKGLHDMICGTRVVHRG